MTALFVLCAGEPGAWAKPLENDKESKDTPTGETAESGPPTLTIKAVIDGRDELRVSREGLDWIHHDWDWPKGVTINKRSWNPQQQPKLKNESTGRFLPADVNFADPELVVVKGRGKVTLRKESADVVVVQLHDTEGGSDEYEVTIKFRDLPWLLKGTPQLPIAKADEMYSGDLRVVATIDGADELRIYRDRAEWQHQGSNWPSSVKINGSEWPVKQQPRLENAAPNQLLPDWTVLVGAKHWVLRGRGTVEFAIHPDHLALQFNDFDPGGDVYDVVVHQGETFTQLEIADADRQQIADLAAKASQAPHPADRNAPTRSDFDELRRRWRLTRFVAAYEQHGHREKAWDDAALEFLKRAAKYPEEPAAPMIAAGDRLIDLGCDDALVCYVHGWNLTRQKQYAKAEPFVLHAVLGFEKSQYPARSKRCAPALLARLCVWQSSDRSNLAYALFQRAVEETAQAIADPMIEGEPRALLAELRDDLSQEARGDLCDHEPALLRALAVKEQADPWIEHVLLASYQHRQGWQGRGDGFANTVSEEGWQLYYRFLLQARAHLVAAWRLHPEFPEAAVEMIMTNRAVGGIAEETPRFWFDQAVAAQIDAPRAHSQFLWAIRPRWGGSHEAMLRLGIECLKTRRFDTTVPACFYDAVHDVASENGDLAGLMNQLGGQDGIRALMNEFEEAPAPPNRSRRAAVNLLAAWHLGWHDDARRRFDSLPEPIDDYLFNLWQVDREFLRYDLGNPLNSAGALRAMQRAATLIQSERPIGSFAVSADGTSVAFGSAQIEQPLTLWNASTGKLHSLDVVNNNLSISLLRVSHDSKKLAALQQTAPPTTGQETSWSSTITVWTLPESAGRIVLEPGRESVWSLCWLPDGRHLALGLASGRAAILSVETGHMQAATPPAGSMALSVAAASQGRALAVGLANGAIKMYELPAAADLAVAKRPLLLKHSGGFEKHIKGVEAVQFSADGKTLASSSQGDRSVWLWDVKSRAALHRLEGRHAVFAPNGRKLATAGGAALRRQAALWDVRTGRADKRMACPGDSELIDVAFTPDSKFLLASTADGTVYAWQADDGD